MLNTGSLFWVVPAMFALFALAFAVVAYTVREARSARWNRAMQLENRSGLATVHAVAA